MAESFADDASAWDTVARLEEQCGEPTRAASALERAAALHVGHEAATRFVRSALIVEAEDCTLALERLKLAIESDRRYVSRTLEGVGAGSEIWTTLIARSGSVARPPQRYVAAGHRQVSTCRAACRRQET